MTSHTAAHNPIHALFDKSDLDPPFPPWENDVTIATTVMRTIQMTTTAWAAVPDSPRQRDTAAHARKALKGHLKTASPTHARVSAASVNGQLVCKLDGHTRSHLWQSGKLSKPVGDTVFVDVYPVKDMAEANALYVQFDNAGAMEDSRDRVAGAFREHNIHLTSPLLSPTSHSNTLRAIEFGMHHRGQFDIYAVVGRWKSEFELLDSWYLSKKVPGSVVSVLLMLIRAYPDDLETVERFAKAVCGGGGVKGPDGSDGACWLVDTVALYRASKRLSGNANMVSLAQCAYACWKRYLRGTLVSRKPVEVSLDPLYAACKSGVRLNAKEWE